MSYSKDEMREYQKEYRERNKDQRKEKLKEYYERNKDQRKEQQKEYRERNKEKLKDRHKEYRERNKEKLKDRHKEYALGRKYGLTSEDVKRKIREQNNCCAFCQKPFSEGYKYSKYSPVVDHNHTTGKVRDILHNCCNTILGHLEDKRKRELADAYFERHAEKELRPATHPVHTSSGLEFLDKGEAHAKTKRRNPKSARAVCERGQMAFSVQGIKSEERPAL